MKVVYSTNTVKNQCTNILEAKKLFGGNTKTADSLMKTVNFISKATRMNDIIYYPKMHFHALKNKSGKDLNGLFSIDIDGRKCPWRLIIELLDADGHRFEPCYIDRIINEVRIVEVMEVGNHYG